MNRLEIATRLLAAKLSRDTVTLYRNDNLVVDILELTDELLKQYHLRYEAERPVPLPVAREGQYFEEG